LLKKRVLICTFVALTSGLSGAYLGGKINLLAHQNQCNQNTKQYLFLPKINQVCKAWVTPKAVWQGSTTGLWMGTILGAFVGGLATRHPPDEDNSSDAVKGRDQE